jgi:hypothetical protein
VETDKIGLAYNHPTFLGHIFSLVMFMDGLCSQYLLYAFRNLNSGDIVMQTVYIDASSAILLYKTGLFVLCSQYFSIIMETDAYKEVRVPDYPGAQFFLSMVQKNRVQVCSSNPNCLGDISLPKNLDLGERQTLALYFQNAGGWDQRFIIIDDAKAAKFCLRRKVPFINALLVPKILWFAGILNKNDYIDKTALVIEEGRYSRTVIEKAKALSSSDLALFIPDETKS